MSEDAAFEDLLRAFWSGAFEHRAEPDGEVESLVFTLEAPRGTSRDHPYSVTHDGHVLKEVVDEATGHVKQVATSVRQALFWTRREFFRFIVWFWDADESASMRIADFQTADEAFRFMAACSVEDYPTVVRALVERLHVSRAALAKVPDAAFRIRCERTPPKPSPKKRGRPRKSCWKWVDPPGARLAGQEERAHQAGRGREIHNGVVGQRKQAVADSTARQHAKELISLHEAGAGKADK